MNRLAPELLVSILNHVDPANLYTCLFINHAIYHAALPLLWHHVYLRTEQHLHQIITTGLLPHGALVRTLQLRTPALTDDAFLQLLRHMPRLTRLILDDGTNITDASVKHVAALCPQLHGMEISHALMTSIPFMALDSLSLQFCPWLLFDLVRLDSQLTEVNITPCNYTSPTFADEIAQWLASFRHLTHLSLCNHNNDYTGFVTTALRSGWTWPLTYLMLDGCPSLDDVSLIAFLHAHPSLELLSVSHSKITDTALDAMHVMTLRCVMVMFSEALTGPGIYRLVKYGASLEEVYLYGCDISLSDLPTMDPSLYEIDDDKVTWIAGHAFD